MTVIEGLPGEELIRKGIDDLEREETTVESLLVSIAWSRLARSGLPLSKRLALDGDPEIALYGLFREREAALAYSRYNSLLRRLVSFERALSQRIHQRPQ